MGINRKHEYRFKYLQSDEWKTVRSEALLREDACCQICGVRDLSNDAHHVAYPPSFWDTQSYHLVILCRPCHDLVHEIIGLDSDVNHSLKKFLDVRAAIRIWLDELTITHPKIDFKNRVIVNSRKKTDKKEKRASNQIADLPRNPAPQEFIGPKKPKASDFMRRELASLRAKLEILKDTWNTVGDGDPYPEPKLEDYAGDIIPEKPSDFLKREIRKRQLQVVMIEETIVKKRQDALNKPELLQREGEDLIADLQWI